MTLVTAGDRIRAIQPDASARLAADVQTVDARGKFLIPGLWDMHAHTWFSDGVSPLFIPNGVTGVRMMGSFGGDDEIRKSREEIAAGKRIGPRVKMTGRRLTTKPVVVRDEEDARRKVREAVQAGDDFIKIYDPLPRQLYFAIADESRKLRIPFAGHVPQPEVTAEEASNAGQLSIEHDYFIRKDIQQVLNGPDDVGIGSLNAAQVAGLSRLFATLRKNNTWFCATLTARPRAIQIQPNDPRWRYFTRDVKGFYEKMPFLVAADQAERARRVNAAILSLTGAMHKAGVGFIAGTDTGINGPFPGFSLHEELQQLVACGLSPMDSLRSATYNAAKCLGLLESLGTIERGKLAEMVLLDTNPLDDIANTQKINMVFTGGRVYRRPALDAILAAVEANARN
jgi:imidazolonepropionase-like amidohydrolase